MYLSPIHAEKRDQPLWLQILPFTVDRKPLSNDCVLGLLLSITIHDVHRGPETSMDALEFGLVVANPCRLI
jgi:hypothetical protein